jgi:hypothetical protein
MGKIAQIQGILGVAQDDLWGSQSQVALNLLLHPPSSGKAAAAWPFSISIEGDDIVVRDVVITCFGGWGSGIADPQDNGATASGVNTRTHIVKGVSLPLDGRYFAGLSPAEHRALDGSPIPRLLNEHGLTAWHTLVEVTIGDIVFTPPDGLVDLGPALQASKPGEPHALDLSVLAASRFSIISLSRLANSFEARGSYRILGGAKLMPANPLPS